MKPCILRAGLKHGPPCVISLEYNAPGRGARKKASERLSRSRILSLRCTHPLHCAAEYNAQACGSGRGECRRHHADHHQGGGAGGGRAARQCVAALFLNRAPQSLLINAAAELGIGKVRVLDQSAGFVPPCAALTPLAQLVASALAHALRAAEGDNRGGGAAAGREVKLRGDDVDLNHL